jgi:hypothetical protein
MQKHAITAKIVKIRRFMGGPPIQKDKISRFRMDPNFFVRPQPQFSLR